MKWGGPCLSIPFPGSLFLHFYCIGAVVLFDFASNNMEVNYMKEKRARKTKKSCQHFLFPLERDFIWAKRAPWCGDYFKRNKSWPYLICSKKRKDAQTEKEFNYPSMTDWISDIFWRAQSLYQELSLVDFNKMWFSSSLLKTKNKKKHSQLFDPTAATSKFLMAVEHRFSRGKGVKRILPRTRFSK